MKELRDKLTLPVLCLFIVHVVFGGPTPILGQGPGTGPGEGESEIPGPVATVNELFNVITDENVGALQALLKNGADPNAANEGGNTSLHWAMTGVGFSPVLYGQVELLLAHGANPNFQNHIGMTPVHSAAMRGASDAVMSTLINAGGDPHIRTTTTTGSALTPYIWALVMGRTSAVSAIERLRPASGIAADTVTFLKTVGDMSQRIFQIFEDSTTAEEFETGIRDLLDELVAMGVLTQAEADATLTQTLAQMSQGYNDRIVSAWWDTSGCKDGFDNTCRLFEQCMGGCEK